MLGAVLIDVRDQETRFLHPLNDEFAGAVLAVALETVEADKLVRDQPVARLDHIRIAVEHVEHLAGLEARALADVEVVEVVPRRGLHRA